MNFKAWRMRTLALGLSGSGVAGLLALQAANAAVFLAPMGCGPHAVFASLLGLPR